MLTTSLGVPSGCQKWEEESIMNPILAIKKAPLDSVAASFLLSHPRLWLVLDWEAGEGAERKG